MTSVMVTVDRPRVCRRITREVRAAVDECRRGNPALIIDLEDDHRGLPAEQLRRRVDVLIVDGHGCVGSLAAAALLRDHTAAVVAPVLITDWCWAAHADYRAVLAHCLGVAQVVQIGSVHRTQLTDARIVYPPVVAAIAQHGTSPHKLLPVLQPLLADLPTRQPWTASVLTATP